MLYVPRLFNTGSPWNVAAGQQGADLRALTQHYHDMDKQREEERLAKVEAQGGKVVTVYDEMQGGRMRGFPFENGNGKPGERERK